MRSDLLQLAAELARKGEVFAMATVVRREPASSTQVGNMAIVTAAGDVHGWLGGSCIRPTVRREALQAIAQGAPRLISLTPDPAGEVRPGVTSFPMTCHSGGSVDVYIEPVLPAARLLVFGVSPAAQALVRLGKAMGYRVEAVDPEATAAVFPEADRVLAAFPADEVRAWSDPERARTFAVVATQGERDEDALAEALAAGPAYVGVVASRTRFSQIRRTLTGSAVSPAALDAVRNPAGIDIGGKAPEEIALSILAEIVQVRRGAAPPAKGAQPSRQADAAEPAGRRPPAAAVAAAEARDPVCGMTVAVATARYTAEHAGRTYYFCCGGCRQRFLAAPAQYVSPASS